MSDAFCFLHSHKFKRQNVVLTKAVLSQAEVKLLMGGLYYAMIRDSIEGRQKAYMLLIAKLNTVIHGKRA